jgi:hypothetical protein
MATLTNFAIYFGFYQALKRPYNGARALRMKKPRALLPLLLMVLLTAIGAFSFLQLSRMAGSVTAFLTGTGTGIVWEGIAVQYNFFIQNIYVVLPLSLFFWRSTGWRTFLLLAIFAAIIPILYAVLLNRRFVFFLLATTLMLFMFFEFRRGISKKILLLAMPSALLVVNLFPLLRSSRTLIEELERRGLAGIELFIGQQYGEVKNGALALTATFNEAEFDLGVGFLRQIFKDYVPSSFIGRDLKNAILGEEKHLDLVNQAYNFLIPTNEFITGITWSFMQFGFLSLVMWYVLGYSFGRLWRKVVRQGDLKSKVLYTSMMPAGMLALYYSPGVGLSLALRIWIIVSLAFLFARFVTRKIPMQGLAQNRVSDRNPLPPSLR